MGPLHHGSAFRLSPRSPGGAWLGDGGGGDGSETCSGVAVGAGVGEGVGVGDGARHGVGSGVVDGAGRSVGSTVAVVSADEDTVGVGLGSGVGVSHGWSDGSSVACDCSATTFAALASASILARLTTLLSTGGFTGRGRSSAISVTSCRPR